MQTIPGAKTYFNPRSPHGERRMPIIWENIALAISIHAPRTGSDRHGDAGVPDDGGISIHAPRTGSDHLTIQLFQRGGGFQSTLPARGATPLRTNDPHRESPFQSTLPARGATIVTGTHTGHARHFNPRSPHGERHFCSSNAVAAVIFQSTLPARGATTR